LAVAITTFSTSPSSRKAGNHAYQKCAGTGSIHTQSIGQLY